MEETEIIEKIESLGRELPHFPDGRIDYTNTAYAPVVTVFIKFEDEILIVRRSDKVGNYKGKWNAITGYLDRAEPLEGKALGEVEEETGIGRNIIKELIRGTAYELQDSAIKKTWLVCPFIMVLDSKPEIRLDFESTEYRWIKPQELTRFDIVIGLDKSYSACLKEE